MNASHHFPTLGYVELENVVGENEDILDVEASSLLYTPFSFLEEPDAEDIYQVSCRGKTCPWDFYSLGSGGRILRIAGDFFVLRHKVQK